MTENKGKIRVGILFGGKSAEHEVSLQSAKNVVDAIDKEKYEPLLIGIDKSGKWFLNTDTEFLLNSNSPQSIQLHQSTAHVALAPQNNGTLSSLTDGNRSGSVDVVFPILHGPFGEDGTVQGLLKLANIPFVGAGVLGSAVGMDKDVMKRLLRDAGLPIGDYIALNIDDPRPRFEDIREKLGLPLFVKPANLGSSIGISKVNTAAEYDRAIDTAFEYDTKIVVEAFIEGREIECAVLGNSDPIASVPGEIIPSHDFYSYEAKYLDESGAALQIPVELPAELIQKIQTMAVTTFKTLCCEGLGRIDFFVTKELEVLVNEINTIPGFTKISMYPRLFEASGIPYTELIDRLIQLAFERFNKEQRLKSSRGIV